MSQTTINTTDSPETGRVAINANFTELYSNIPIKRYVAFLTQTGTSAPTAVVAVNTLGGTVVWTRGNAGNYIATLSGAFIANKTVVSVCNTFADVGQDYIAMAYTITENLISFIFTAEIGMGAVDDILSSTPIIIEVYP